MCDDFGEGEIRRFDVEVTFHNLEIGGYGAEEIVGLFVGKIAEAEDLTDFVGGEEFFKL